jgi:hypothetical protein
MTPKPAIDQPTRPGEQYPQVDEETARILTERLAETDNGEPWAVVKKRILERRPAP